MPIVLNGTNGTITGLAQLPDSAMAAGSILQIIEQKKLDTWSSTADFVFSDVTGLSVSITPSSASNKILVLVDVIASSNYFTTYLKLFRGSTELGNDATGKQSNQNNMFSVIVTDQTISNNHGICHLHNRSFLDSPNTTSAVTYKIQSTARNGNYSAYINRSIPDRNLAEYDTRHTSKITVMEVAAWVRLNYYIAVVMVFL